MRRLCHTFAMLIGFGLVSTGAMAGMIDVKLPDACIWRTSANGDRLWCTGANGKPLDSTVPGFDQSTIDKARGGDATAMTLAGDLYAAYLPDTLKDGKLAYQLFKQAAGAGAPGAMFGLGFLYDRGLGVPVDEAQAAHWFETAAGAGSVAAMFWTANFYENGVGVGRDGAKAVTWYQRAAGNGDMDSMGALSLLYREGHGVAADSAQADVWWSRYLSTPPAKASGTEHFMRERIGEQPGALPRNTGAFVPYCMGHFGTCRLVAGALSLGAAMTRTGGCGMSSDPVQTTKQALGWLIAHPETRDMPVRDGVLAAVKAVSPC